MILSRESQAREDICRVGKSLFHRVIAQCNWQGWVGCEYRPKHRGQPGGTTAGLGWLQKALR